MDPASLTPTKLAMIYPQALQPGDTLAIISTSAPSLPEAMATGVSYLESLGYRVKVMPHALDRRHYLAGDDAGRLADLHGAFADPEVKGILCARGGYGAMRLLPGIDWDVIRANPKVFIGFSDLTSLIIPIFERTGLVTFHGPMLTSNLIENHPYTQQNLWHMVSGESGFPHVVENLREYHTLNPGTAEGRLIGGNLSLLTALCGTPYQPDTRGALVFIEDWHEAFYSIDRQWQQLKLAGFFDAVAGLILADFVEMSDSWEGYPLQELFKDLTQDLKVPAGWGLSVGHADQTATIPIGAPGRFDATTGRLEILSAPVRLV